MSVLKFFHLLIKIVSPALIALLLLSFQDNFWGFQFVLIFAIVIIPFNINKLRINLPSALLLSVVICFLVLFLSLGIVSALWFFITDVLPTRIKVDSSILGIQANDFTASIAIAIISPILMFFGFRLIFTFHKTNFSILLNSIAILILFLIAFSGSFINNDNLIPRYWQVIMAITLQVSLYQNELKEVISK